MYAMNSGMVPGHICCKQIVNGFEISIAFDDWRGRTHPPTLGRSDIRVWKQADPNGGLSARDEDVTEQIFGNGCGSVTGNIQNLSIAFNWCIQQ